MTVKINKEGVVQSGHARVRAAKALGVKSVPFEHAEERIPEGWVKLEAGKHSIAGAVWLTYDQTHVTLAHDVGGRPLAEESIILDRKQLNEIIQKVRK